MNKSSSSIQKEQWARMVDNWKLQEKRPKFEKVVHQKPINEQKIDISIKFIETSCTKSKF